MGKALGGLTAVTMATHRRWHWPLPEKLRWSWRMGTVAMTLSCLTFLKTVMRLTLQRVQTKNLAVLKKAVRSRPPRVPLVTVCNHASCIDDPVMWDLLPLSYTFFTRSSRWTPVAQEMCFKTKRLSRFFSRMKAVPVVRGDGVYQRGMTYCLRRLNDGDWVNVFPEGKINVTGEPMRMKWGVGRLIAEAKQTPLVIPLWHVGMDDILPNKYPYIPQFFKKLTVLVGEPIDFTALLRHHRDACTSAAVTRSHVTAVLQARLHELQCQAEALHHSWQTRVPCMRRSL